MNGRLFAPLLLGSALAVPVSARAQQDHPSHGSPGLREVSEAAARSRHHGFWLSAGLGAGGERFDANDGLGWSDSRTGGTGYVRLGATVSPSFLVGAEVQGWTRDYYWEGYHRTLSSLLAIGQWYPGGGASNFWVRGGLGWAHDDLQLYGDATSSSALGQDGTAFVLGLGFDLPMGSRISVTPQLDFNAQHYDSHQEQVLSLGLGITFH